MDIMSWVKGKKAQDRAESTKKKLDEAVKNGDSMDEVKEARVDMDGETHDTLDARLEQDFNNNVGSTKDLADKDYVENKVKDKANKDDLEEHKDNTDNPHDVTSEDVTLIDSLNPSKGHSDYPIGLSCFEVSDSDEYENYPDDYGTVFTVNIQDNRMSQLFFRHYYNESQNGAYFRHYNKENGWSDWFKISTEEAVEELINEHKNDSDNPHGVNKKDVGLSNLSNDRQATRSEFEEFKSEYNSQYNNVKGRLDDVEEKTDGNKESISNVNGDVGDLKDDIKDVKDSMNYGPKLEDFLEEPFYICHRGARNVFPENSLEAFQGCITAGNPLIEYDVQKMSDGSLAVMHDDDVKGTTGREGKVKDFTAMGWRNLKITALDSYKDVYAPMFEDVLRSVGRSGIHVVESKDRSSMQDIADTLRRYDLQDYAFVQSFDLDDALIGVDEGITTLYLNNDIDDPEDIKDKGIDYVGTSKKSDDSYIESLIEAGLKVIVYTVNKRERRDELLELGVSGFFSDDPFYLSGDYELKKDPFLSQTYYHGTISSYTGNRGGFKSGNRWGFLDKNTSGEKRDFVLQGWAGGLPKEFDMEFKVHFDQTDGGWASAVLCSPTEHFDDGDSSESNGYHLLITEAGNLILYIYKDGINDRLEKASGDPVSEGDTATVKVTITKDKIEATWEEQGLKVSQEEDTFRNGYFLFGRKESKVSFSDVKIK